MAIETTKFTNLQLEMLKLFGRNVLDNELLDIKRLIGQYFAEKASDRADKIVEEKGYTNETFENWLNDEKLPSQN
jgi:hypothetical protein